MADRRLEAARHLAAHVAAVAPLDLGLRLWDGSLVPLGPGARTDLAIAIRDAGAISTLVRRPGFGTLVELLAAGLIDIEGGTLLDVAARREGPSTRGMLRRLDKRSVAGALWPFLIGRGVGGGDHAFSGADAARAGAGRDDTALVRFHYDLSNAFYRLFLDPVMQYSCGYFSDPAMSLEAAQQAKMEMICRKLRLRPGLRFLDIGCGWGGLICHAAKHHGVVAHGITLSQAQAEGARARIAAEGLEGQVTVEIRDWREVRGAWDRIASIGMFEHVGLANAAAYVRGMRDLLVPRGIMLHHAITRPAKRDDRAFRRHRPEYRAITRYIFPGGELDHIGRTVATLEANGFEVHDVEGWREHYAATCRAWTRALEANRPAAEAEVGSAKTRLWLLYLAGCALAFERGGAAIFQTVATRRARGASGLPPTRADLYR